MYFKHLPLYSLGGKEPVLPIGEEAKKTPKLVWMLWREKKSLHCLCQ